MNCKQDDKMQWNPVEYILGEFWKNRQAELVSASGLLMRSRNKFRDEDRSLYIWQANQYFI